MSDAKWSEWTNWNSIDKPPTLHSNTRIQAVNDEGDTLGEGNWNFTARDCEWSEITAYRYRLDDNQMTPEEEEIPAPEWSSTITDTQEEAAMVEDMVSESETIGTLRSKYHVVIKGVQIDVYDVLHAFGVTNPADAHAIKKMLKAGQRGYKDANQDRREAIDSIIRAMELEDDV